MFNHAPLLENAFLLDPHEGDLDIAEVEGTIPPFVRGTYYLNGPGRFGRTGTSYRHWLDGDGKVCALRVGSDGIRCATRFVRGVKFQCEEAAGHAVFRTFGTTCLENRLKRGVATESPLNVSIYQFGRTLLAFGEQSLPWELAPVTLETRGPYDFAGQLNEVSPFGAHPRFDPASGEMFNFGVAFSPTDPRLHFYRFERGGRLLYRKQVPLPYPCTIHDFALSQRYAVFYLSPYLLNLQSLMREGRTTMESLTWQPQRGSSLLVVQRETGAQVAVVPVGRRHCLHLVNAFDDGACLTVDVLEYARPVYDQYQELPNLFQDVPSCHPVRFVLDTAHAALLERRELPCDYAPDFPSVAAGDEGRPYHSFWTLGLSCAREPGRKFFDQLVRRDWFDSERQDVYRAPPNHYFGGQPAFLGNPHSPETGVVVCPLFDAQTVTSSFLFFQAFALSAGPVATVRLKQAIHLGFHCTFTPQEIGVPH